jgi:hypothetical protein
MIGYKDYINKIKDGSAPADFDGLYGSLGRKLVARRKAGQRSVLAGAVAILMISLAAYLGYPLLPGGNGQLFSYVFDQQELADGPVINYVYSDGGTF